MAESDRIAAALSYEQDRPAFGNPSMLEQGRKMRERKQAEQVDRSAQNVKSDLLARALMYRYNPETLTGLTDTPGPQTLDEAAGLNPRVDRSTFLPYSQKEGMHVPAVAADLMKLATASNPQYSNLMQPEEAMPLATNMMGGGVVASRLAPAPAGSLGMNVWHGSPHRFPPTAKNPLGEFDPMKIGTGEGAQAYGVGAGYLAENPQTARIYSADRAYVGSAMQGKPSTINFDDPAWLAQKTIDEFGDTSKATSHLKMVQRTAAKQQSPETKAQVQAAIDLLESGNIATKGNLYKVDLPDEHIAKMLDWDKPLSQQAPEVQKAIKDAGLIKNDGTLSFMYNGEARTGGELYERLTSPLAKKFTQGDGGNAASKYLNSIGIKGIRYLDQGSRGAGQGTSNFVVFDPAHMNIIGRE